MTTYDDVVARSPQAGVFAASWWLDAVAPGAWRPHVVELGDRAAAWPTVVASGRAGVQHRGAPLTPYLGPLLAAGGGGVRRRAAEQELLEALLERIGAFAHLEARCHPAFDYWAPLSWHGFTQTTRYTWRMDELGDLEATWEGLRENVRREVRKARKRGVVVAEATIDEFLPVRAHTLPAQRRSGAHTVPESVVRRVDAAAAARDARTILVARGGDGRAHAGAYLVHDAGHTYYLMGGSDPEARGSGAMSLVLWTAIEAAARRGAGFDFEGSMLRPIERFFRAFGGEPVPYSVVRCTPSAALRRRWAAARAVRVAVRRR